MPYQPPDPRRPPASPPSASAGFSCPYCGKAVRQSQRLSYPAAAIGAYAPVYRCGCGRHIGAPVALLYRDEWE